MTEIIHPEWVVFVRIGQHGRVVGHVSAATKEAAITEMRDALKVAEVRQVTEVRVVNLAEMARETMKPLS